MSTARIGAPAALMASITAASAPSTGAFSPVPSSASTTTPARREARAQRVELRRRDSRSWSPAPRQRREHLGRVAAHVVGAADEPDLDAEARARAGGARCTKPSPPLLPLPAARSRPVRPGAASMARSTRAAPSPARSISDVARRAVLDRPAIERAHLRRGDDDHAGDAASGRRWRRARPRRCRRPACGSSARARPRP